MLIILGGLPGTGKSTIGKLLAEKLSAVYLRIDSIEQAIEDCNADPVYKVFAEGYMSACAIARDNLSIGMSVVADSVNPIDITRMDWVTAAQDSNKEYIEIEIICSDKRAHRNRVESRKSTVKGLKQPSWQDVLDRDYESWEPHLQIDTAEITADEAVAQIVAAIGANNELSDTILALEKSLLDSPSRNSKAHIEKILADDFVEFGSSGRKHFKDDVVAWLTNEQPFNYEIKAFKVMALGKGFAHATYRIRIAGSESLRSSIWCSQEGGWQMLFHQGTKLNECA